MEMTNMARLRLDFEGRANELDDSLDVGMKDPEKSAFETDQLGQE